MEKLPSGQVRNPSHSWGVFAQDPSLDVGIVGEAWADMAASLSLSDIPADANSLTENLMAV
jgi:hypothetical protein